MISTGIIYKATSPNGKSYIGQTIKTLSKRKRGHELNSLKKDKDGKYISKGRFPCALRSYSFENFVWTILYDNVPKNYLNDMEILAIELHDTYNNGYNDTIGGEGSARQIWPEERRKKQSIIQKEVQSRKEVKERNRISHLGKKDSEETRLKKSLAQIGKPKHSEQSKQKIRLKAIEQHKKMRENNLYGKSK